jgi:hypothetical protein
MIGGCTGINDDTIPAFFRNVKLGKFLGAPKNFGYLTRIATRGYLFRKTHKSIRGAP